MHRWTMVMAGLAVLLCNSANAQAFYHPTLGRWVQRDRLVYRDGTSLYQYTMSLPTIFTDAYGLQTTATAPTQPKPYEPRFRMCCLFERDMIKGPADIGSHAENKDGIVFTCRCGWLDTGHIRQSMDVFLKMYGAMSAKATKGTIIEGIEYKFELSKNVAAADIANLAASMAYDEGLLHEIGSVFNKLVDGGFNSAFSPEDLPSNTAGVHVAQENIAKMKHSSEWPKLMDAAIQDLLKECAALPKDKGQEVWDENVKNKWVGPGTGLFTMTLLRRNFSNGPWNIKCKQCEEVKDKSVPKWLSTGISLDRPSYGIVGPKREVTEATRIDEAVKAVKEEFEKKYGKESRRNNLKNSLGECRYSSYARHHGSGMDPGQV